MNRTDCRSFLIFSLTLAFCTVSVTYAATDTPKQETYRIVVPAFDEVRDMRTVHYHDLQMEVLKAMKEPVDAQQTCNKDEEGRHFICSIQPAEKSNFYLVIHRDNKRYCAEIKTATRNGKPLYDNVKGGPTSCKHYLSEKRINAR